ncbi:MAG TPA: 50S ribosomal protein L3 [Chloroflexota bacterium]|nr:50S ribosomal protein L3 [Chloroflexota bacterium]
MSLKMGLLGRKIGMTQVFHDDGSALGVTAVSVGPCVVVAKRTEDKHGYSALQLGFEEKTVRLVTRPESGYFKKANIEKPLRHLREVRLPAKELEKYEVGKVIRAAEVFKPGDVIDVVGTTKGKGYQGVMKKHKMAGDSMTHGTHEFFRHGGSIGCRLTPGRVHKGKRMGGHMGDVKKTVQNLVLLDIDEAQNLLLIQGSVPGARNGYVVIRNAKKKAGVKVKLRGQGEAEVKSKNPMKASKAGAGAAKGGGAKPAGGKK